jgi:(5-formylfuran-3-yl)methyl phosphate synthase
MQLLVSVRSAAEAEAALEGGASLIDVKEPSRGSLGRADEAVVRAVVQTVAGRRPVSAALGELPQGGMKPPPFASSLRFVKWGLASRGADKRWEADFLGSAAALGPTLCVGPHVGTLCVPSPATAGRDAERRRRAVPRRAWDRECGASQAVLVAYADPERAGAPPVADVVAFACRRAWPARQHVLLLDTFDKHPCPRRPTLLDWLSTRDICDLCERCRTAGVRVALAGSLGTEEIRRLLPARPDWFAVRGAVCEGCDRHQSVRADRVRGLVRLLQEAELSRRQIG